MLVKKSCLFFLYLFHGIGKLGRSTFWIYFPFDMPPLPIFFLIWLRRESTKNQHWKKKENRQFIFSREAMVAEKLHCDSKTNLLKNLI